MWWTTGNNSFGQKLLILATLLFLTSTPHSCPSQPLILSGLHVALHHQILQWQPFKDIWFRAGIGVKVSAGIGQRTRKDFVCSPLAVLKPSKTSLTSSQHAVDSLHRGASSSPSLPVMPSLFQPSQTWSSLCVSHLTLTLFSFFSTAPVSLKSSLPPSNMAKISLIIFSVSPVFGSTLCIENGWKCSEDGTICRCWPTPTKVQHTMRKKTTNSCITQQAQLGLAGPYHKLPISVLAWRHAGIEIYRSIM